MVFIDVEKAYGRNRGFKMGINEKRNPKNVPTLM